MQERLHNNDTLIYSRHNEGKSVITEIFVKTLKTKIFKKITANDSKSYLPYLNKLVNQYNNTYHHSIKEKPINADYSALTEKIETNHKATKFKVNLESAILSIRIFLLTVILKIDQTVLKTNPWTYKIKFLDGEKIIGGFYEKELLLSKLQRSYYPEPDNHIRVKVKVVLDLSNYATKKN